jgi:hypothetical protein
MPGMLFIFIIVAGVALAQDLIHGFAAIAAETFFVQGDRNGAAVLAAMVAGVGGLGCSGLRCRVWHSCGVRRQK